MIRGCREEQGISISQISEHLRGIPKAAIRLVNGDLE